MTIAQIIIKVRYLLGENIEGRWTDAELLLYGKEGEIDIIKRVSTKYLASLLINKEIATSGNISYIDGSIHNLPADYLRFKAAQNSAVAPYVMAEFVEDLSDIKSHQVLPSFAPSNLEPICFMENPAGTKGLIFCPSTATILLHYYKEPPNWESGNSPLTDVKTHDLLVNYICKRATEGDKDFESSILFDKNYTEGVLKLEV